MLRKIEWGVQNGPIKKPQTFATDHFIFLSNQLESIRTSYIKSRALTFQKNI